MISLNDKKVKNTFVMNKQAIYVSIYNINYSKVTMLETK